MTRKIENVDLPRTLERSPAKAQRTDAKVLEQAEQTHGPGERAGRTACGAQGRTGAGHGQQAGLIA